MSRNARMLHRSENEVQSNLQEAAKRTMLGKVQNTTRLVSFFGKGDSPRKALKTTSMKESTNAPADGLKARLRETTADFKVPLSIVNRGQNDIKGPTLLTKQTDKLVKQAELMKLNDGTKATSRNAKLTVKTNASSRTNVARSENVAQKILSGDSKQGPALLNCKPAIQTRSRAAARRIEPTTERMDVSSAREFESCTSETESEHFTSASEYLIAQREAELALQPSEINHAVQELRAERALELANFAVGYAQLGSASRLTRAQNDQDADGDDEHDSEDSEREAESKQYQSNDMQAVARVEVLSDEPTLANDPQLRRTLARFEAGDAQLLAEYVDDHFAHMRILEVTRMVIRRGYMMAHWEVKPRYRELAFDWLICVAQRFNLLPETYYLATHLFDRFMQQSPVPRVQIQLVAIASLYVASKIEETYLPDVSDFLFVTDDAISRAELYEAERKLLETLQFAVNAPNPLIFLRRFSRIFQYSLMLARNDDDDRLPSHSATGYTAGWIEVAQRIDVRRVHQLSKYILETSTYDYELAHIGASQRAAASLLLAMRAVAWPRSQVVGEHLDENIGLAEDLLLETESHGELMPRTVTARPHVRTNLARIPSMWTTALVVHSEHSEAELLPILRRLAVTLFRTRRDAKLQSTRTKYSDAQFDAIARGVELEIVLQRGEQLVAAKNTTQTQS